MNELSIEDRMLRARAYYCGCDPNSFVPPATEADRKRLENGFAGLERMGVAAPGDWDSVVFDANGIPSPADPLIQEAMEIMKNPEAWREREEAKIIADFQAEIESRERDWNIDGGLGRRFT